jgi:hypothetical protein
MSEGIAKTARRARIGLFISGGGIERAFASFCSELDEK